MEFVSNIKKMNVHMVFYYAYPFIEVTELARAVKVILICSLFGICFEYKKNGNERTDGGYRRMGGLSTVGGTVFNGS